ncbi:MAG: transglycosylase SLT domain-containing protein [Janthinobacterium lividum]
MRLYLSALLVLLLAACAGTPSRTSSTSSLPATVSMNPAQNPALKTLETANHTINLDHETVGSLATGPVDIWQRIRSGFQIPDLTNDAVQTQVDWYATRPDYVARMTERSKLYLYHIVDALEQRHMPTELALLPFIESAYNPQALSSANASGMWQFVRGTGRTFNLRQNMFQDQRRDVIASTNAALDYLSKLHDMFGDWDLALAAYNWGEGNVQKAIARNIAQGLPGDYESLRMPNETRNYVPKLQAVKNIIANPQAYGLELPDIPNHPYFVTVTSSRDMDVKVAAQLAGLTLDQFKALNPSFSKPVILGATDPQILLPFENAETFEHNLKHFTQPLSSWTTYTVTQREKPAALAAKIGVDADTLLSVNRIPAGMRLKPGSTVLVPKGEDDDDEDISADIAESAVLAMEPDLPDTRKLLVRVRRRQTIAALAHRYGVSVAQIQSWNHTRSRTLASGQRLVLHIPVGRAVASEEDDAPRVMRLGTVRVSASSRQAMRGGVVRVSDEVAAPSPTRERKAVARGRSKAATAGADGRVSSRTTARGAAVHTTARASNNAHASRSAGPIVKVSAMKPLAHSSKKKK